MACWVGPRGLRPLVEHSMAAVHSMPVPTNNTAPAPRATAAEAATSIDMACLSESVGCVERAGPPAAAGWLVEIGPRAQRRTAGGGRAARRGGAEGTRRGRALKLSHYHTKHEAGNSV